MKKALIKDTRIYQVTDTEFPVHPSLQWVDVPDDTTERDTYENGAVVKYVPPVEPAPIDQSDIDNIEKQMKALALVMRSYCNALNAGTYTNKSVAALKADFKQAFDSLP